MKFRQRFEYRTVSMVSLKMYMESTYLQSDLTIKVKMRTYIRLLGEGATF